MKKWFITIICLSFGWLLPVSALADSRDGTSTQTSTQTSTSTSSDSELELAIATFDVTDGFEQEVDLESLTKLQWTFMKGEATATYQVELPGKQLPATGWKEFYTNLGWDTAKTNMTEITFSDETKAILYSKVIGNSGKVRFWMDGSAKTEDQKLEVETKLVEEGIKLRFSITSYYIIWVNGQEFARISDNQILVDRFLLKGSNRITIERTDDQFISLDTQDIFRLFIDWNQEVSAELDTPPLIEVVVPTNNGKTLGSNVELSFQWISEEPKMKGIWYIWVDQSTEAFQTDKDTFILNDLSPGTHQVKVELQTESGVVIDRREATFVVPTQSGGVLPNTATPWPNMMAAGILLILAGAFVWVRRGRA